MSEAQTRHITPRLREADPYDVIFVVTETRTRIFRGQIQAFGADGAEVIPQRSADRLIDVTREFGVPALEKLGFVEDVEARGPKVISKVRRELPPPMPEPVREELPTPPVVRQGQAQDPPARDQRTQRRGTTVRQTKGKRQNSNQTSNGGK